MLRWFSIIGAFMAGAMFGMTVTPARAQECLIPDPQARTVEWTPPTECENGDALGSTEACPALDGFRIYYGTASGDYVEQINITEPTLTSFVLDCLSPGVTYYVAMTAYVPGAESRFSEEIDFTTGALPNPPTNLTVSQDNLTAYVISQTEDRLTLIPAGTVPEGTECDGDETVNGTYRVPTEAVVWAGSVRSVTAFARCSPSS